MRKASLVLYICLVFIVLCLTACRNQDKYIPTGEFYVKTPPSYGDAGASNVISLEAAYKNYEGSGDITVPMIIGFGHLPERGGYGEDVNDTFYIEYKIIETPWSANKLPAWEKKVEYADSWYDEKYNSTEQRNSSFLIIPLYGQFYPLYVENIEIMFPAEVEKGYLEIQMYISIEGNEPWGFSGLQVYFEREDGMLKLTS